MRKRSAIPAAVTRYPGGALNVSHDAWGEYDYGLKGLRASLSVGVGAVR